jgi:hypothetical protein
VSQQQVYYASRLTGCCSGCCSGFYDYSTDDDEDLLLGAAYETINELIGVAPIDCHPTIMQFVPKLLERLQNSFSESLDKEQQNQAQAAICSVLEASISRVEGEFEPAVHQTIELLFRLFQSKQNTVHEEGLSLMGVIIQSMSWQQPT